MSVTFAESIKSKIVDLLQKSGELRNRFEHNATCIEDVKLNIFKLAEEISFLQRQIEVFNIQITDSEKQIQQILSKANEIIRIIDDIVVSTNEAEDVFIETTKQNIDLEFRLTETQKVAMNIENDYLVALDNYTELEKSLNAAAAKADKLEKELQEVQQDQHSLNKTVMSKQNLIKKTTEKEIEYEEQIQTLIQKITEKEAKTRAAECEITKYHQQCIDLSEELSNCQEQYKSLYLEKDLFTSEISSD